MEIERQPGPPRPNPRQIRPAAAQVRARALTRWLLSVSFMVLAMVAVGGITRLTGSGLSITEWKPIMGAIPPLGEAQWLEAFGKYQQIPQFKILNSHMTLAGFKWIFFWEYIHRLLGRSIALVYILPWIALARAGHLSRRLHRRLAGGFVIFGLQGLMGWVMVASGLSERTSVSHYRLAAHLALALTALGYLLWVLRAELPVAPLTAGSKAAKTTRRATALLLVLVAAQVIYGALMAGLKAGYLYATFPTMNGSWFPAAALALTPGWLNFLENPAAVHFMHRTLGWLVAFSGIALGVAVARSRAELPRAARLPAMMTAHATLAQFLLGVVTVLTHVAIPVAVLHQVFGAVLLGLALWTLFTLRAAGAQRVG